jgi:hypothetical protein
MQPFYAYLLLLRQAQPSVSLAPQQRLVFYTLAFTEEK